MNQMQANLSEQDLLNDLLLQEKQLIGAYSTFITEASCQNLRQVLTTNLTENCNDQYQIFAAMKQKGYYQTKDAPTTDVQSAKQKFQQIQNQLN